MYTLNCVGQHRALCILIVHFLYPSLYVILYSVVPMFYNYVTKMGFLFGVFFRVGVRRHTELWSAIRTVGYSAISCWLTMHLEWNSLRKTHEEKRQTVKRSQGVAIRTPRWPCGDEESQTETGCWKLFRKHGQYTNLSKTAKQATLFGQSSQSAFYGYVLYL